MIDFPIVDTHVHLLDINRFKYSWAAGAPKLGRDWTVADLLERARPYRIESFVFVEVDVDQPQYLDEADWVQSIASNESRLKGCVASLPMEKGPVLEPELARLASLKIMRGIRRLIQNQPDPEFMLKPDFLSAVKLLPKYNLSFDICIYHHQLANTIELVRRCPEVSFVLDHIAKPGIKAGLMEPWKRQMREMAALPNILCKLSGVTTEADHGNWTRDQLRPYIDHAIECFGFDRVMYGGDWPVAELAGAYTDWPDVLDWATSGCAADEKRKLFRDNGIRAYRLAE
jgi:L-fuconolactonase